MIYTLRKGIHPSIEFSAFGDRIALFPMILNHLQDHRRGDEDGIDKRSVLPWE
jgi:hypothetical protein